MIAVSSLRRCVLLPLLLLGACASAPPEHFYTLEPSVAIDSSAAVSDLSIAVGPLSLPELIDRPQMVLQSGSNQVDIPESRRWAESLRSAIPRVISGNLRRLLPGAAVATRSEQAGATAKYNVAIDIFHFDARLGDATTLEARWRIQSAGRPAKSGLTTLREPVQGADHDAVAAAHGRALAALSRDIAAAIGALERAP